MFMAILKQLIAKILSYFEPKPTPIVVKPKPSDTTNVVTKSLSQNAYEIAKTQLGVEEVDGDGNNKIILKYHQATDLKADEDSVPWCFTRDEEILTESGWIKFSELSEIHGKIGQINQETMEIEFVKPLQYISYKYEGLGYEIKTRSLNLRCTKDHKFFGYFTNNFSKKEFRTLNNVTTAGIFIDASKSGKEDNPFYSDTDLEFIAAFMSDGFYHNKNIEIQVSKNRKIESLTRLNPKHVYTSKKIYGKSRKPLTTFSFNKPEYFDEVFGEYKCLKNNWIFSLSCSQARKFLSYYSHYDGHKSGNSILLSSSKKEIVDALTIICSLAKAHASVSEQKSRLSNRPCWTIRLFFDKEHRHISKKHITEIKLNENVYCVSVPSGVIVIRTKDKSPLVVGNCSSFMNWCIQSAGGKGTRNAMARSWLNWGKTVLTPKEGDTVIFSSPLRGPSAGHVAFYVSHVPVAGYIKVLGGNQQDAVSYELYPTANVLGYRRSTDG